MWKVEDIQELILTDIIPLIKKADNSNPVKREKTKLPEFNPVYIESVELAQMIELHSDNFPDTKDFFDLRAPKETEEEREQRKSKFEPVTKSAWMKAEDEYNRIFQEGNFSIIFEDQTEEDAQFKTQDYLSKDYPVYGSLLNYYQTVFKVKKNRDPNAVIAHKPTTIVPESEPENPIAVIYDSRQVIRFEPDHTLILLDEHSLVGSRTQVREGLIFEFYDDTNIWRIEQFGKKADFTFNFTIFFKHDLEEVPTDKLKNVPCQRESDVIYESQFMPAVFILNNVLWDSSDFTLIKNAFAKPEKWAYAERCIKCTNGKISGGADGSSQIECPDCKGTTIVNISNAPGTVRNIVIPKGQLDNVTLPTPPLMGFVTPPVESLAFYRTEINDQIEYAFGQVGFLPRSTGPRTATEIDREKTARYNQIFSFSNQVFKTLAKSIDWLGRMRQPNFQEPTIIPPKKFDLRTEEELVIEYNESKGQPEGVRRLIYRELLRVRFNSDETGRKKALTIERADRILTLDSLEMASQIALGLIAKWEGVLHTSASVFLAEAISEHDKDLKEDQVKFLDLPMEERVLALETLAKAATPAAVGSAESLIT